MDNDDGVDEFDDDDDDDEEDTTSLPFTLFTF